MAEERLKQISGQPNDKKYKLYEQFVVELAKKKISKESSL